MYVHRITHATINGWHRLQLLLLIVNSRFLSSYVIAILHEGSYCAMDDCDRCSEGSLIYSLTGTRILSMQLTIKHYLTSI